MQFSPGTLQQEKGAGWGLYSENICFDATFLQLFSLIVCKGIVELHGGTIRATSNGVGEGSCFSVELPVATGPIITNIEQAHPNVAATNPLMPLLTRSFLSVANSLKSTFCSFWRCIFISIRVESCPDVFEHDVEPLKNEGSILDGREEINMRRNHSINSIIGNGCTEKDDTKTVSSKKRTRVLIVDDVAMNRKMLKRLLIARFDECDEAENGQQAVDMAKSAMALGLCYDIITMDYQMPIMDGVTATRCIRKLGYKGQIIGVTGNALQEDVATFVENGANIVLTKPLSISKFDEYLCNVS